MNSVSRPGSFQRVLPFLLAGMFFLGIAALETGLILAGNNGMFIYTLDDPYIHLALAENIMDGHYGVNAQEFSAPSSSIIWPFLLAPLSGSHWTPLLLNLLFGLGVLYFVWRLLDDGLVIDNNPIRTAVMTLLLGLFVLCSNLIGLVFTGMEHVLQVLLVTALARELIRDTRDRGSRTWLTALIIIAPLVRYENMAVSGAAVLYLLLRRQWRAVLLSTAGMGLTLGGFAFFLVHAGHRVFPTSVVLKLGETQSGFLPGEVINHLKYSLAGPPQGMLLVTGMLILLGYALLSDRSSRDRALAAAGAAAIAAHLAIGGYGWYHRYEIYIWVFLLLLLGHMAAPAVAALFTHERKNRVFWKFALLVSAGGCLVCSEYIWDLSTIPYASNNIYEQHYQMHRFAVDYYKRPVAVNDIGYVTYKNPNYVLDLWGLSSLSALTTRLENSNDLRYTNELLRSRNVRLAMIYPRWFTAITKEWIKVGELVIDMDENRKIGPAERSVSFFAVDESAAEEAVSLLHRFEKTLPRGTVFIFSDREQDR
ncbi:hypothetical protein JXO52_14340 [bacterium]|nr:hypothetical protein [bacterium]